MTARPRTKTGPASAASPSASKTDPTYTASQTLLELAGVKVRQHKPTKEVRLYS